MILNNASNIKRGGIQTDFVYHGDILIWPPVTPPEPPIDPDKYEDDYSNKYTVVLLDSRGYETNDIAYFDYLDDALAYLEQRYNADEYSLFNVYCGNSAVLPSSSSLWEAYFNLYFFNGNRVDKQNIKMFRYPQVWPYTGRIYNLSGFNKNMTKLETVILPEMLSNGSDISIPSSFLASSGVSKVIFRSTQIVGIDIQAFANCSNLKKIELPYMQSRNAIGSNAFYRCSDITITLNNSSGSINRAPWGATNATVVWKG